MALAISASSQDAKSNVSSNEYFDSNEHAMATSCVLGLIWSHQNSLLRALTHGSTNDPDMSFWEE